MDPDPVPDQSKIEQIVFVLFVIYELIIHVYNVQFLFLPGSGSKFPEEDPDPAKLYGSKALVG